MAPLPRTDVDALGFLESIETRKLEVPDLFFASDFVKFSNAHGSFRSFGYIVRSRHMSVEELSQSTPVALIFGAHMGA
jgi:hypothetical protein